MRPLDFSIYISQPYGLPWLVRRIALQLYALHLGGRMQLKETVCIKGTYSTFLVNCVSDW
jgi:hypothetical protein